jgi:hypothetical protein
MSLCAFDFGGCGRSDGCTVSLGWWERDDVATVLAKLHRDPAVHLPPLLPAAPAWRVQHASRSAGGATSAMGAVNGGSDGAAIRGGGQGGHRCGNGTRQPICGAHPAVLRACPIAQWPPGSRVPCPDGAEYDRAPAQTGRRCAPLTMPATTRLYVHVLTLANVASDRFPSPRYPAVCCGGALYHSSAGWSCRI